MGSNSSLKEWTLIERGSKKKKKKRVVHMLLLQVYPFFHFRLVSFKHLSLNTDPASNKKKERKKSVQISIPYLFGYKTGVSPL